jgi:adenine-specific DNA methylase
MNPIDLQASPHTESNHTAQPLGDLCFIETQFPVSKMSMESYKERKANYSQTLTGLGKWWGRKPLVLCRAAILGLLLPATDDPKMDREVFLRLMTMDEEGLLRRKTKSIPVKEIFKRLPPATRGRYFTAESDDERVRFKKGVSREDKEDLQQRVFLSLSYDERLDYCDRPEQIDGPSAESWQVINGHLGTSASSLPALVAELGKRRFGHVPRVGDAFCGGGSIPFEAARLGCEAYGSDLNPVAALLTWAALNIVGGGPKVAEEVRQAQREVYDAVDRQVTAWGIEHRTEDVPPAEWKRLVKALDDGKLTSAQISRRVPRADAYLYCVEVVCPETGWSVPLAPSWVIGEKSHCVARLVPDRKRKRYEIEIRSDVSDAAMKAAKQGTVRDGYVVHPILEEQGKNPVTIQQIRMAGRGKNPKAQYHESGLRLWENDDVVPRPDDVFQERLYCVRWVTAFQRENAKGETVWDEDKEYRAPTEHDLRREDTALRLLSERFHDWQANGYIPSTRIEPGVETERLQRERGWTHWHHLFNPRQLLQLGFVEANIHDTGTTIEVETALSLGLGKLCDWNTRLCKWTPAPASEKTEQTFLNQAFNTLLNYGCRPLPKVEDNFKITVETSECSGQGQVETIDARAIGSRSDIWISDPPYADAINYHELSEHFLGWYRKFLDSRFHSWHCDSRRALAVTGSDENFRRSMVDCYRNLAAHMPDNGLQIVMFTHQDAGVWADLSLILWAAGLRVTAAWCIATETDSALKEGNYVQGTVLLVLRKQTSDETTFLDEVYQEVEAEVRRQLDTMRDLDDAKDPNFGDTDYQLAAYAAALRVLTSRKIEEIDVAYELTKVRAKGEKSPVEELIQRAVKIACDHLVPRGVDTHLWKSLSALERFYLKGLELESHGEHRVGVYQELARGFGVEEYKPLLASTKANETRLKTAVEFGNKEMGEAGFGPTLVRHALFAVCKTMETENPRDGLTWLTTEVKDYASSRARILEILEFLATLRHHASLPHWHQDAEAAAILAGALRNRMDNV